MNRKEQEEPVFELYPNVEEGICALEKYVAMIERLQFSAEPVQTIREAIDALKSDPVSSIMFGLDPAPDGLKRIIVVGAAARDRDSIRRSLLAMRGLTDRESESTPANTLH